MIEMIGKLAGILSFVAFVLYYISIVQGRSRPNRVTWIILTVVGILILASYYASGARNTLWVPVAYTIGPLIAALLAFKYGEGGASKLDMFCLFACGMSIVLWIITESPLLTLLINIGIDFVGMIPTLVKSFLDPLSEDVLAWWVTVLSNVLNVMALETWEFSIAVYPIYMVVVNGLVALFLLKKFLPNRFYDYSH